MTAPASTTRGATIVDALLCAAALTFAASLLADVFDRGAYLVPLGAGAVAGALLGWRAGLRRWPNAVIAAAAVVGYLLLLAVCSAWMPAGGSGGIVGYLNGIAGGWIRLLTSGAPVPTSDEMLTAPMAVTWVAAVSAGMLCARAQATWLPAIPVLAALPLTVLLAGRSTVDGGLPVAGFLAALIGAIAIRGVRPVQTSSAARRGTANVILTAGTVIVLGLLVGQSGLVASGDTRADVRDAIGRPIVMREVPNPLALVKAQLQTRPPRPLFTVTATGVVTLIRTAVLSEFDGALWTSADTYLPATRRLARDRSADRTTTMTATFEILGLSGPLLPSIGWPRQLEHPVDARLGVATTSGALATELPRLRGLRYRMTADMPLAHSRLTEAVPSRGSTYERYVVLPAPPPRASTELLHRIIQGHPDGYGRLAAIENYLARLPYDLKRPAGHSYRALDRFLRPRTPGDGAAHAEQHAAAFAVWARQLGYPSRIAVGYRVDPSGQSSSAHTVTTADAHTWPEVHFDRYGWVAFEPTDPTRLDPPPRQPMVGPPPPSPSAVPTPGPTASRPASAPPLPPGPGPGPDSADWLIGLGVLGAAPVAAVGVTIAAKQLLRTIRRRRASPAGRVTGAWSEVVDRMRERRFTVSPAMTPTEVAAGFATTTGASGVLAPAMAVADAATAAVYRTRPPGDDDARSAWSQADRFVGALYPRRWSWRRMRALVHPAPIMALVGTVRRRRREKGR